MMDHHLITTFFWNDTLRLSQAQLLSSRVLGIAAIFVAWYIFNKQLNITRQQFKVSNIWSKLNGLTSELAIGHGKLEHVTLLLKEAEEKGDINTIDVLSQGLNNLKSTMDALSKSRNDTFDLYDKEIIK